MGVWGGGPESRWENRALSLTRIKTAWEAQKDGGRKRKKGGTQQRHGKKGFCQGPSAPPDIGGTSFPISDRSEHFRQQPQDEMGGGK